MRVREAPGRLIGYKVTFEGMSTLDVVQNNVLLIMHLTDKKVLSEDEKKTQEYDALAFRLVGYAAFPMLAGYTIYSRQPFVLHPISADHRTSSVLYEWVFEAS